MRSTLPISFQIGTDIVSVRRIKETIERHGATFLNRIFTRAEQAYCEKKKNKYESYAARFAAKEAVIKAKGGGRGRYRFRDIEVTRGKNGQPMISIPPKIRRELDIKPHAEFRLTLAHEREFAIATVVLSE